MEVCEVPRVAEVECKDLEGLKDAKCKASRLKYHLILRNVVDKHVVNTIKIKINK